MPSKKKPVKPAAKPAVKPKLPSDSEHEAPAKKKKAKTGGGEEE